MSNPNYKSLFLHRLKELTEETKDDYTLGDVLYSMFRKISKPKESSTGWMMKISDEEYYQAVEKALREEEQNKIEI